MALKTRQQLLDEEYARINALGGKVLEQTQNLPEPGRVGDQSGTALMPGYAKTADGRIVSQGQLQTGLLSATPFAKTAGPDLTNQVQAAQAAGQVLPAPQPGQPQIQLGGAGQSAPIGLTNQQTNSAVARTMLAGGGVRQVTPTGTYIVPLKMDTNYSASGLGGAGVSHADRAAAESAQALRAMSATNSLREAAGVGMTHEAQARRTQAIEQAKATEQRGLASAAEKTAKMQNDYAGKIGPAIFTAQGKENEAMINKGLDPRTGQPLVGANQPEEYVTGSDGVLRGKTTGKPAPDNVLKQYSANITKQNDIEAARALPQAAKASHWNPFSEDNVWGKDPKTGKFKEFGSQDALNKDKNFVPLSPEEQKAYEEGNKGLKSAAPVAPAPVPVQQGPQVGQGPVPTGLQGAGTVQAVPAQPARSATPSVAGGSAATSVRAELLGLKDAEQKKNMIRAKLQDGTLTKAEAKALAIEHGLQ